MKDFELRHWRPQPRSLKIPHLHPSAPQTGDLTVYTSLCDVISPRDNGAVNSPTASDIRIRNPLVKQAAYAYLQPTPSTTDASATRRCCPSLRRALAVVRSCFGFIGRFIHSIFC